MTRTIEGVVRAGRIELIDGPELAEGQHVQVAIQSDGIHSESTDTAGVPDKGVIRTPAEPELLELLERTRRARRPLRPSPTGPRRQSAAGMLADAPDFDTVMAEIERERRADFGREVEG
jgi:hypothetical protein